jgi:hypothetical protein
MASSIPLIGAPQQLQFPQIGLNIVPQGMVVSIQLGPTTSITQVIDASTMDQVVAEWRDQRKNAQDILHTVQATKNN